MTIALVHYPVFTGEMQVHTRRIIYTVTLLCGSETEQGTVVSTEAAAVTCAHCAAVLAEQAWRFKRATTMP
jgi:hypothetical protein